MAAQLPRRGRSVRPQVRRFGERRVEIGGLATKVFLFVATLGYSRRLHVRSYRHERQEGVVRLREEEIELPRAGAEFMPRLA